MPIFDVVITKAGAFFAIHSHPAEYPWVELVGTETLNVVAENGQEAKRLVGEWLLKERGISPYIYSGDKE